MEVISNDTHKGGAGKSWTNGGTAVAIKHKNPGLRVGILDGSTDQAAFSFDFAGQKERDLKGFWSIYHAMVDPAERRVPGKMKEAIRDSVTNIRVLPDEAGERGSIQLINCSREFGRHYQGHDSLKRPDSWKTFGLPLLQAIEEELGLDYLIVDFLGVDVAKDPLKQMLIPCCTNISIPVDVRLISNAHGMDELIDDYRNKFGVRVVGLMGNFAVEAEDCKNAQAELKVISDRTGVPLLSVARYVPTLSKVQTPLMFDGELAMGAYIRMADKGINGNVRSVFETASQAVDLVADALMVPSTSSEDGN